MQEFRLKYIMHYPNADDQLYPYPTRHFGIPHYPEKLHFMKIGLKEYFAPIACSGMRKFKSRTAPVGGWLLISVFVPDDSVTQEDWIAEANKYVCWVGGEFVAATQADLDAIEPSKKGEEPYKSGYACEWVDSKKWKDKSAQERYDHLLTEDRKDVLAIYKPSNTQISEIPEWHNPPYDFYAPYGQR